MSKALLVAAAIAGMAAFAVPAQAETRIEIDNQHSVHGDENCRPGTGAHYRTCRPLIYYFRDGNRTRGTRLFPGATTITFTGPNSVFFSTSATDRGAGNLLGCATGDQNTAPPAAVVRLQFITIVPGQAKAPRCIKQ